MVWLRRFAILGGFASFLILLAPSVRARQNDRANSSVAILSHEANAFAGVWDYNPQESVNAATGKPEQSPRSATLRTPGRRGGGAGTVTATPPPINPGGGLGASGYSENGPSVGLTPDMVQESRDVTRDLLEVPEELTIRIEPQAVTFIDDLERLRTYPTNGLKQKYQLGAARFDAEVRWDGPQLLKRIEGPYGFRMTETYFLSPDGQRLFVIVRVGHAKPRKDEPVVGVNRVYDKVE